MAKEEKQSLLIVESPAKAKTIEKYLGKGFSVTASIGHLFDLPKSRLAIDIEHNFEPEYITIRGKAKILKNILREARKADSVLLASDNDREGEAIAFHIQKAIKQKYPEKPVRRIVFNEITPHVIREAVKKPLDFDINKVNAQKARRILDRLVGYSLSPILWKKVKNGLSAGRVQSVALRLICERDNEVDSFIPEEYWTIDAELKKGNKKFTAQLVQLKGEKCKITTRQHADEITSHFKEYPFSVSDVKKKEKQLKPVPPFTTSKLQQVAANRFGFTSKKTMTVVQTLYEGITMGQDRVGLITYIRTDSTRISNVALEEARVYISENFPEELPENPVMYASGNKAQDAHEAIRPTYVTKTPGSVKNYLNPDQCKLYSIIWERFVASQMKPAKSITTMVDLICRDGLFRASATSMVEKGFYRVLSMLTPKEKMQHLPSLAVGDVITCLGFIPDQHFTQGPAHYTDATIIKALEDKGIGRPSTYAPIISVLIDRYYIVRKNKKFKATVLGKIINNILLETFPDIINVNFTAQIEKKLDEVEENGAFWVTMIKDFYTPFNAQVVYVMEHLESIKGVLDEETPFTCEKCGRPMVKKLGRYGFFLACSGFPECKNSKAIPLADCPREHCDGKIIAKRKQNGRGKVFYGCTNFPDCNFVTYFTPTEYKCPLCGYFLVERSDKKRGEYRACVNPECHYIFGQEETGKSA
jgi:DNA topoisomerase-1